MAPLVIIGIDPGLVDTAVVAMVIYPYQNRAYVDCQKVTMQDDDQDAVADEVKTFVEMHVKGASGNSEVLVFIESYRERGNSYATDPKMRNLVLLIEREVEEELVMLRGPGQFIVKQIDNTGVKKVVRRPLLEVFGLTGFPSSHHQDFASAARILMYGALKLDHVNEMLAKMLFDHVTMNKQIETRQAWVAKAKP